MLTKDVNLPTVDELTVQEINLSTPFLKAGAMHLGKQCEAINNEFMLCRREENDPRKCIEEGKMVTACAMKFFQMVKGACATEFTDYATCIDKSSYDMSLHKCRNTQAVFDSCMLTKLGMERPPFGYLSEARIHITDRPRPALEPPPIYPDALPDIPKQDVPRTPAKYGSRYLWWS